MDDSNIPDALPKSPEEVALLEEAIARLLGSVPDRWQPIDSDDLTSFEQRAQLLLVAAGMIERRLEMKVEALIVSFSATFEVEATGEYGIVEALEPVTLRLWSVASGDYEQWKSTHGNAPTVHFEIVRDRWRLTDQGLLLRKRLSKSPFDRQDVFDFVLRQGYFAFRSSVRGAGRLIKMTRADGSPLPPLPVAITNWDEGVKLFAEEVAKAMGDAFARWPRLPVIRRPG